MPPEHENISIKGAVADLFGHRFVVKTKEGKVLADLGPKGAETVTLAVGDEVELTGERKPSEIKVRSISTGGRTFSLEKAPHSHDAEKKAVAAVEAIGFKPVGRPEPHPKHYEILAERDGERLEFHVEFDGSIRKTKPAKPHKRKAAP